MIDEKKKAEIRRLFFAEHWRIGTIVVRVTASNASPFGSPASRGEPVSVSFVATFLANRFFPRSTVLRIAVLRRPSKLRPYFRFDSRRFSARRSF